MLHASLCLRSQLPAAMLLRCVTGSSGRWMLDVSGLEGHHAPVHEQALITAAAWPAAALPHMHPHPQSAYLCHSYASTCSPVAGRFLDATPALQAAGCAFATSCMPVAGHNMCPQRSACGAGCWRSARASTTSTTWPRCSAATRSAAPASASTPLGRRWCCRARGVSSSSWQPRMGLCVRLVGPLRVLVYVSPLCISAGARSLA